MIIEIEYLDDYLNVDFRGDITWDNNGIGSYEFWGDRGYDEGEDYPVCENITWNQADFTINENEYIRQYLEDNKDEIEKQLTSKL